MNPRLSAPKHKVEVFTDEYPKNLRTAEQISPDVGVSAERLVQLADEGFAPHYRIDAGPPLFRVTELRAWVAANLLAHRPGRPIPGPLQVTIPPARAAEFRKIPASLQHVAGLFDVTDDLSRCGIYFLCKENEVVYVGQSINAASRITEHRRYKDFDTVLFLGWPAEDLSRIEAAFIRALAPVLNGRTEAGKLRVSHRDETGDAALIESVSHSSFASAEGRKPDRASGTFARPAGAPSAREAEQ